MGTPATPAKLRILAYGFDRKGITRQAVAIETNRCVVSFGSFKDAPKFDEFDGVVFFQGIFESFERIHNSFSGYLQHECDEDELDKRNKEVVRLIEQDGIVCVLLSEPFRDNEDGRDFRQTDLSKRLLTSCGITRKNFTSRCPDIQSLVDEIRRFVGFTGQPRPGFRRGKILTPNPWREVRRATTSASSRDDECL